ncbi:hypothetical protein [Spirilliplanes yamanashiensis]|uniref:Uncharacterized protein n=1 Tax=Spirilliplanes yamanashiensis TaxID=42233 RepID=A0A8J3YAU5_9ACTN|nr:hypothetical protein [Spirilliplanes yamanashiensis]MDP9817785.1 hypothetical protein [Spirilliplanes yamanashiensis]GIJ04595.1 hypothetical protein Sya03_39470 [Spirilliplanes yamanashiensis]
MQHSNISLLTLVLVGGILIAFGYGWAVMRRANRDYKATKGAVKSMRKGFWASFRALVKVGVFVAVAVGLIVTWNIRDARDDGATPLFPARVDDRTATPSPEPTATRR